MKHPVLAVLAVVVALGTLFFVWSRLDSPARGSARATPAADAPAPAAELVPAALARPAESEPAEAQLVSARDVAPEPPLAEEPARTAAEDRSGRTVRGTVAFPAGSPRDDSLRVIALAAPMEPRFVYGVGGVLDDVAAGKKPAQVRGSAEVDESGRFTLALAAEATVWLVLDGRYLHSGRAVPVPMGETSVTLAAELGASLAGEVRLPAGLAEPTEALAELELELGPGDDFSFSAAEPPYRRRATVDADGRFEVRAVKTGDYELELDSDHCADAKLDVLGLEAGERRELTLALVEGATLRGSVRDEGGRPLAGAEVFAAESEMWGFPGEELAETTSEPDGSFVLAHVRPGKCLLLARLDGYLESEPQRVELREEERGGFKLTLGAGASLAGRAQCSDGSPAAAAEIEVEFDRASMVGMGAMNAARGASGKTKADADGAFVVTGLGKGPFQLEAELVRGSGEGETTWRGKLTGIAAGSRDLALTLEPPCDLVGRVQDEAGEPVTEFRLRAHARGAVFFDPGTTHAEECKSDTGEFRLPALAPGVYEVTAEAAGFGPPAPLEVTLPRTSGEPVIVVLAPAASVAGQVLDPTGTPVSGARVGEHVDVTQRLQRMRDRGAQPEAQSGADGAFLLESLGAGHRLIQARSEGFAASEPVAVQLRAGERSEDVVLRLRKGAVVTGEVYGPDERPAGGVRIIAQSPGGLDMNMKQTDPDGRFRIENLDPGSWTITALLEERDVEPGAEASETTAAFMENLRFTMVQLEEGEEEHVVLGAPPADPVLVRGHVRHGKEPVTGGIVSFFAEGAKGMQALKMAPLGSDGAYEARLDEPGRYGVSVQINADGSALQQQNIEFRASIPEVEEHTLDLDLPLGSIAGRVRDGDGQPLGATRVTLVTEGGIELGSMLGGQYSEATTDEDGRYAFDYLRPGDYAVAAGGALFGGAFGNTTTAGRRIRAGLRVEEGRRLEGIDFELDRPGSVGGKVVDARGAPLKDAAIFVRDASGRLVDRFSMIASGPDGSFEYLGLAPGEYVVSARAKELASSDSAPVRVEEGARATVELVLHPGTKLVVEVGDQEGNAVQARVSVTDPAGREVQGMVGWAEMTAVFAEGLSSEKQVVGPLPPGSYTVTAVTPDGKRASKPVTLDGQPERRLKLRVR